MPKQPRHLIACAVACLCLSGCYTIDVENEEVVAEVKASVWRVLDARKGDSARHWKHRRIGDEEAVAYVWRRTALLLDGDAILSFHNTRIDREKGVVSATVKAKSRNDSGFAVGTACAISRDGYYLTAAHSVDSEPTHLLVGDEKGARKVRARLIWKGPNDEPDLALIHAPVTCKQFFPLARPEAISPGLRVLTDGYGSFKSNPAGGKILKRGAGEASRWLEFHHDAPFVMGDSGGPVVDENGRLLGVSSAIRFGFHRVVGRPILSGYRCQAYGPDPDWIRDLIAKDRVRRGVKIAAKADTAQR